MKLKSLAIFSLIATGLILNGMWIGWTLCESKSGSEFNLVYDKMNKIITASEHSNVESAIISLEISVKCGDPTLVVLMLDIAKTMSATAGGYGSERIQKIEDEIKQKKSIRFPKEQDQQYSQL